MIDGVIITPLSIIKSPDGDVLHAMKRLDAGFVDFGEVYFSEVKYGSVKAWKKHTEMTLNLVVPIGEIKFVLLDDRKVGNELQFQKVVLSRNNYVRLTIPPMIWVGFQGISKHSSLLLNVADISHIPDEVDRKGVDEIKFNWDV